MKKLFLDTNFIIDYLLREEFKNDSQQFLAEGSKRKCKFYNSFLSVANFAYIDRKLSTTELYRYLSALSNLFIIIPNTDSQIKSAIDLQASDFEDALQYQAALDAGCECIITRNEKDFGFSQIPVSSASDFVDRYFRG